MPRKAIVCMNIQVNFIHGKIMKNKVPESKPDRVIENKQKFMHRLVLDNALATQRILREDFDVESAKQQSTIELEALSPANTLQAMLASQMLTVHKLQHTCTTFANNLTYIPTLQYYTNTAIKLANIFVQQANLFAKLQGMTGQKVVVEKVDISEGGQAIIGTVNSTVTKDEQKK